MELTRREFNAQLAGSVLTFGLVEMLWVRNLFADAVKPVVGEWFKDLNAAGADLHSRKLKDVEFQAKLEELFRKVDLNDLLKFVDLSSIERAVALPDNGAASTNFDLSKVEAVGFADLTPGSGHGLGGFSDMGWMEVYGKAVAREGK